MKNILGNIILPTIFVGMAAAQAITPDVNHKFEAYRNAPKDSSEIVTHFDLELKINDKYDNSGIIIHKEFDDSAARAKRDSIKIPDSLRYSDPFLYKYYKAVKDSFTHRETVDSLKASGDTIEWHVIDSLYFKDSATVAKEKFDKWYSSLSKKERKKYDLEQSIPIKRHKMDSIFARRDSIKAAKDSITEATPRIWETFAVSGSMKYKRVIKWTHDRNFHKLNLTDLDTSYNYYYHDYPFLRKDVNAVWLGNAGSPLQTFNAIEREYKESVPLYQYAEPWTYTPSSLPMYNTKTPYTELAYWGTLFANSDKASDNIRIFTSQNIIPELNFTLEYNRFGSGGMLQNEITKNKTFVAASNYLGKRYMMHSGYIYNMLSQGENGGMKDISSIWDSNLEAREININLSNAKNRYVKHTVFLDQQYKIPFKFLKRKKISAPSDSTEIKSTAADSLRKTQAQREEENITSAFIGHSSEYSVFRRLYTDEISLTDNDGRAYYNNTFNLHPTSTRDSSRIMKFDNKVFLRLQPWADNAIISKINVGIGNKLMSWYKFDPTFLTNKNTVWGNSMYVYAGAEGYLKKYISWNADFGYTFLGREINNLNVNADFKFNFYPFRQAIDSPISLNLIFKTDLSEPDFYMQHYSSTHYRWDNNFNKISQTTFKTALEIPYWRLSANIAYSLLGNHIMYDNKGYIKQTSTPISLLTAEVNKNFKIGFLHLDNRILLQLASDKESLPLPLLALNLRYYIQFNVKKDIMQAQIGINTYFNTSYYTPMWNPAVGAYCNQNQNTYGNHPYFDIFANIQWKRACIFIKMENAGKGWPMDKADYFSADRHIITQRTLKLGIFWPFYIQPHKHVTASSKAGSGMSGGLRL